VNALVLAAGYATRLRPLTDDLPKQLLPVGGRPMIDRVVDKLEEIPELRELHVVTNRRYASAFGAWAGGRESVFVHDDGTTSNDDRLGAIGDLRFVLERTELVDDHLLVIAGDNLLDASLAEFVAWWRGKGTASALAVYDVGDLELARQYGIVELGSDGRVVAFEEKPAQPGSTLAATAMYIFHREHVALVEPYLAAGNPGDQPGNLIEWLHRREPVYGYALPGEWHDIGTPAQLLEADNRLRARAGLPVRAEYALD
jgi:glucose-1-phosphate thymidylyltransferase